MDYLTAETVARILGVTPRAVLRSSLPRVRLGHRTIRFRRDHVAAWISDNTTTAA